jgi:hypothetical protein
MCDYPPSLLDGHSSESMRVLQEPTLLVNSPCPKFYALRAGFVHGMCQILAGFDSRF